MLWTLLVGPGYRGARPDNGKWVEMERHERHSFSRRLCQLIYFRWARTSSSFVLLRILRRTTRRVDVCFMPITRHVWSRRKLDCSGPSLNKNAPQFKPSTNHTRSRPTVKPVPSQVRSNTSPRAQHHCVLVAGDRFPYRLQT